MSLNNILTRLNFVQEEAYTLGILVIANEVFSKQLGEALHECHKNESKNYRLYFVACATVEEVLHHTNYLHVDYVVFLLDTRLRSCALDVEYNLQRMHKSFLCGRTCIVNATPHISLSDTNVSMHAIIALKKKYDLPIINGDVMNPEACRNLAQRLLILIQTNLGVSQNAPFGPWLFQMKENNEDLVHTRTSTQ